MAGIALREHVAQLYEDEELLAATVARFAGAGIGAGDNVIIIACGPKLTRFREMLEAEAIDLERVMRARQVTLLDAEETLDLFMDGDMPDVARFLDVIGGARFDSMRARPRRYRRAYGEMVDVLGRRRNARAAIALEGLWNELAREHAFSLLCGYAAESFSPNDDPLYLDALSWAHTKTIPPGIKPRADTSS